jgi:hypothetical protein
MWVVNKLLARVLRALAGALEPEAGPAPPGEVPLDTRMALLRRRYLRRIGSARSSRGRG